MSLVSSEKIKSLQDVSQNTEKEERICMHAVPQNCCLYSSYHLSMTPILQLLPL